MGDRGVLGVAVREPWLGLVADLVFGTVDGVHVIDQRPLRVLLDRLGLGPDHRGVQVHDVGLPSAREPHAGLGGLIPGALKEADPVAVDDRAGAALDLAQRAGASQRLVGTAVSARARIVDDELALDEHHAHRHPRPRRRRDPSAHGGPQPAVDDRRKLGGHVQDPHRSCAPVMPTVPDRAGSGSDRSRLDPHGAERHRAGVLLQPDEPRGRVNVGTDTAARIRVGVRRGDVPVEADPVGVARDGDLVVVPRAGLKRRTAGIDLAVGRPVGRDVIQRAGAMQVLGVGAGALVDLGLEARVHTDQRGVGDLSGIR